MNKLFYGDNLDVMRKFIRDETVALCYIDPPFNSKRNYNQIYNNIGTEDRGLQDLYQFRGAFAEFFYKQRISFSQGALRADGAGSRFCEVL